MKVEQDDQLDKAVRQNSSQRHADQVFILLPPVADVARKGQKFEYGVQERDDSSRNEEPGACLGQHALDLIHLATTASLLRGHLVEGHGHRGEQVELPVGDRLIFDVQGQDGTSLVDWVEIFLEEPKVIREDDWEVLETFAGGKEVDVRGHVGLQSLRLDVRGIRDDSEGQVR